MTTDALTVISAPGYAFTRKWFKKNSVLWANLFERHRPARMLEIGSFEGYSACWSIAQAQIAGLKAFEIHCIDSWEGGIEHQAGQFAEEMEMVEQRFLSNIAKSKRESGLETLDVQIHKGLSYLGLADLIAQRRLGSVPIKLAIEGSA